MRRTIYILVFIFAIFLVFALRPIKTSKKNAMQTSGIVTKIREGGVKDVVFELANNETAFYINRGLENRFNLASLRKDFLGKKVTIFYSDSWTPLAPFGISCKPIFQFQINDSIVYTEFK